MASAVNSENRLLRAVTRLAAAIGRLERQVAAEEGVTASQMRLLLYLAEAGGEGGIGMGELAREQGLAISTMTRNVHLLETRGWVLRTGGTTDKRRVLVQLRAPGRELAQRLQNTVLGQFSRAFRNFHPSDRVERAAAVGRVAAALEQTDTK